MPSEDYAPAVRGGLKLKGGAPTGVTKKKKKKKKKQNASKDDEAARENAIRQALEEEDAEAQNRQKSEDTGLGEADLRELESRGEDGKTASERQFEEVRRKRLRDRLEKEGVKTHKQRVEELNKYLSNLSEHHDMPRIGPG